jgi:molybdopterin biosynthesis enzyme
VVNEAAADADLIVSSGGISMGGERDSIKAGMQGLGAASFCTVAIHPGKPQGFGVVGPSRTPVVMLPGNPVSALCRSSSSSSLRSAPCKAGPRKSPVSPVRSSPCR